MPIVFLLKYYQLIRLVREWRRESCESMFRAGSDVHSVMLCQFYRDGCESARSQLSANR